MGWGWFCFFKGVLLCNRPNCPGTWPDGFLFVCFILFWDRIFLLCTLPVLWNSVCRPYCPQIYQICLLPSPTDGHWVPSAAAWYGKGASAAECYLLNCSSFSLLLSLNFKDPEAVRALTCTLLREDFGLSIDIPLERLIPTVPLRLNYIHWVEDLIGHQDSAKSTLRRGIDIGKLRVLTTLRGLKVSFLGLYIASLFLSSSSICCERTFYLLHMDICP